MPPLEYMDFHNRAILWVIVGHTKNSMPKLSSPVQICCRWEEGHTELVNTEGQNIVVDVVMATNRDIVNGSLLWEGTEEQLSEYDDAPPRDIYEVIMRSRGDSLNGRVRRYEYGLKRFKDTLPQVVQ